MNRLVIIGNGFDLAHGLPTSYKHFIDDYWREIVSNIGYEFLVSGFFKHEDELIKTSLNLTLYDYYSREKIIKEYDINSYSDFKNFKSKYDCDEKTKHHIGFKSYFFQIINERNSKNWVDIENEYYYQLKKIVKSKCLDVSKSEEYWKEEQKKQVIELNKEFEEVKKLLEKYLNEKVVSKYNFNIDNIEGFNFHNIFFPDILDKEKIVRWKEDFSKEDKKDIDELIEKGDYKNVKLRFLNFNYTPTSNSYARLNFDLFQDSEYFIHGELNNLANKINFGFGDEMDDDYKLIENINDNEYLKNFKSFQYIQNDTYKKLLDFVESEKFEVFIMGSSCGLSDRTLLNTIFEHNNCRSIKVFYHQKEDGSDNYTEIIQNISRHFNKKKIMREKIVNKTLCQPLPQIQLPKKE